MAATQRSIPADRRYGYDDLRRLMALQTGDEKHDAASTSTLDVIWVLYDQVLDVAPDTVDDPQRDRFLLSKGHGPMAYYAVLAAKGFVPVAWLPDFGALRLAARPPPGPQPGPRCRDLVGVAGSRPSARGRDDARAAGPGHRARASSAWSATPSSTRAPTPRRSRSPGRSASTG